MSTKNVLIIDDCSDYTSLLKVFLKDENIKIKSFDSSLIAKDYILKNSSKIDLIILDLMMPELSGIELLRQLKEFNISHKFKVCVLSDKRAYAEIEEVFKLGADEYFLKSENVEILVEKIYNFLDGSTSKHSSDFISLLEITDVIHDFKILQFDESHVTFHSKEEFPIHSTIQISSEVLKKFKRSTGPVNCIVDNCEILDDNILITCQYLDKVA